MTQSMWQQTEEMAKKHEQNGGAWLKLQNDGDKAVVVFLGEPYPREVCFVDGKYLPFDEKLKAQGLRSTLRIALNAALYDTKEVKVLEVGVLFFKDLVRLRNKYGLSTQSFEVQRHGAAKDPKTTYSILPEHQLTPEQQQAFSALPLHDLAKLYAGEAKTEASPPLASYDTKAETAIDPRVAQAITAQLKTLPRAMVDQFLAKFGVQRVKDIPAAQAERALEFAEQTAAQIAAPAATDTSIDPFS